MKYFSATIIFIALTFFVQAPRVSAASLVAGALEPTQILNNIELVLSYATQAEDTTNTVMDTMKNVFENPIAAALISSAQEEAAKSITNWATGGFQGNSSIIADPEQYIKNQGLEAVRAQLGSVPTGSAYGDSILASVISSVRSGNNPSTELRNLASSQLPSLIQSKVCDDAQLNELVRGEGLTVGSVDFTARKQQLFSALCTGNPANDAQTAQALSQLASQQPEIGGLDALLLRTYDNPYIKASKAAEIANRRALEVKNAEEARLNSTGGVASQRNCKIYASNDDDGNFYPAGQAPCLEYETITPGGLVEDATSKSLTAGLDRLTNLQTDGFNGLLSAFATMIVQPTLNRAFSSAASAANTAFFNTTNPSGVNGTPINTTITQVTNRPYTQNLLNDPDTKATLTAPIFRLFTIYLKTLGELEPLDESYMTQILNYEATVNNVQSCYDNLVATNPGMANNAEVISANDTLKNRQVRIDAAKTTVQVEQANTDVARTLVTTTKTAIDASNSSQQINDLFKNYQNQIDTKNLPTVSAAAERQGDFEKQKVALAADVTGSNGVPPILTSLLTRCQALSNTTTSGGYVPVEQGGLGL